MPEVYVGTKFRTLFARREAPVDPQILELIGWCHRLAGLGLAPGGAGNLSLRRPPGFVVSRTAADLGTITAEEFVQVLSVDLDRPEVEVVGLFEPSSESLMHAALYAARPGVQTIFHGHDDRLLAHADRLGIPATLREQPYGTPEVAREVLELAGEPELFVIRNHGFVSVGQSMREAGERVVQALALLRP
jgi:L-ribulose-5-phosphate 4-epimerase